MNRNMMYEYLRDVGLYSITRWSDDRKSYHMEFRLDEDSSQKDCTIILDWGYIRHIKYIWLCSSEIVIEGAISDMKININYRDIKKFEVKIEYDD